MIGYKATYNGMCINQYYEVGETYSHYGTLTMCRHGFHFCDNILSTRHFYDFNSDNLTIFKVKALGEIIPAVHEVSAFSNYAGTFLAKPKISDVKSNMHEKSLFPITKYVTNKVKILEEIPKEKIKNITWTPDGCIKTLKEYCKKTWKEKVWFTIEFEPSPYTFNGSSRPVYSTYLKSLVQHTQIRKSNLQLKPTVETTIFYQN